MASTYDERKANISTGAGTAVHQETSSMEAMRHRAQDMGAQIRDKVQETSAQVRDKAQDLGSQAKEKASEYYAQGRESLAELNHTLEAQIRERPLQSLLIAGGMGLLLGLLWRRR
jgi:ElaB/YqjD/DUF883 family membrane-anchored ribosome-binding protein